YPLSFPSRRSSDLNEQSPTGGRLYRRASRTRAGYIPFAGVSMTAFVLVLVAAVITAAGWMLFELVPPTRPGRRPAAVAITAVTAAAMIVILFAGTAGGRLQTLQGIFALVLAVCGGAILTIAVFEH